MSKDANDVACLHTCELDLIADVCTLGRIDNPHSPGIIHVTRSWTSHDRVTATPHVNRMWSNILCDECEVMTWRITHVFNRQWSLEWICSITDFL